MEYVIETKSLTKRFPSKLAVNQIDMRVRKGDIYGLIGKNGAGKTTAMKMMLGTLTPTSGEIRLFESEDLFKERKRIGALIEAPGIYKSCTAYENMKRFSILYGGTDQEIKELLSFVGLGNVGRRKAGAFSLGMKQRLGIAIALLGNPELMILDEPINGLDPAGIKEFRDLILKLNHEKGVTFLISSHLLDELGKIATRYGILHEGELVEEISAEELADRCKIGVMIRTDAPAVARSLLDEKDRAGASLNEDGLFLPVSPDRSAEINARLVSGGVAVREIFVQNNDFEDYFIQRLGK